MAASTHSVSPQVAGVQAASDQHIAYRPDVDGLRAIAVLGVLLYHAAPRSLPGGFAGVDVFFVISGYLISGLILQALRRDAFSVVEFYARRIKRIFPALIAMLAIVWAVAWPILLADEYRLLGKHILAGAGFAQNLVLYREFNGYFGLDAPTTPLLHLWSLGVEEQFYFLWPLFLVALWKFTARKWRGLAILGAALVSFALNVALLGSDASASFYLPWARLWELAAGSALASWQMDARAGAAGLGAPARTRAGVWFESHAEPLRAWSGIALIAASYVLLDGDIAFPGWWALLPCVGAVLVISARPTSWVNRHLLGSPPMVFIGLISYPLYLWHWPLLSIGHILSAGPLKPLITVVLVLAALGLAIVTYKYVELPIRRSRSTRPIAVKLGAAMAVSACVGYATFAELIQPHAASYDLHRFVHASTEDWLSKDSRNWTLFPQQFIELDAGPGQTLFIGDSNMQQFYPRIAQIVADQPRLASSATFSVRAGCAPAFMELLPESPALVACRSFLKDAMERAMSSEVDTVVLASYWRGYVVSDPRSFEGGSSLNPRTTAALEDLKEMLNTLRVHGKRVYLVLNIPTSLQFDPRRMIQRTLLPPEFRVQIQSPSRAEIEAAVDPISTRLRQIAQQTGTQIIDPVEALCDSVRCPAVTRDGDPIYRDFAHLRPSYVAKHVRFLDETVLRTEHHAPQSTSSRAQSQAALTGQRPTDHVAARSP